MLSTKTQFFVIAAVLLFAKLHKLLLILTLADSRPPSTSSFFGDLQWSVASLFLVILRDADLCVIMYSPYCRWKKHSRVGWLLRTSLAVFIFSLVVAEHVFFLVTGAFLEARVVSFFFVNLPVVFGTFLAYGAGRSIFISLLLLLLFLLTKRCLRRRASPLLPALTPSRGNSIVRRVCKRISTRLLSITTVCRRRMGCFSVVSRGVAWLRRCVSASGARARQWKYWRCCQRVAIVWFVCVHVLFFFTSTTHSASSASSSSHINPSLNRLRRCVAIDIPGAMLQHGLGSYEMETTSLQVLESSNDGDGFADFEPPEASPKLEAPINVVVIVLESVRPDVLTSYQPTLQTTPFLDKMVKKEGHAVKKVYAGIPNSSKSFYSIFCGQWATTSIAWPEFDYQPPSSTSPSAGHDTPRSRYTGSGARQPNEETCLPFLLKREGYATAFITSSGIGPQPATGFETNLGWNDRPQEKLDQFYKSTWLGYEENLMLEPVAEFLASVSKLDIADLYRPREPVAADATTTEEATLDVDPAAAEKADTDGGNSGNALNEVDELLKRIAERKGKDPIAYSTKHLFKFADEEVETLNDLKELVGSSRWEKFPIPGGLAAAIEREMTKSKEGKAADRRLFHDRTQVQARARRRLTGDEADDDAKRPFLLAIGTSMTHSTYEESLSGRLPPGWDKLYFDSDEVPLGTLKHNDSGRIDYLNAVAYVDRYIEQVHTFVERAGAIENTVFVVVGDHGEGFGEHDYHREHGGSVFEVEMNVPLLLFGKPWKRVFPNGINDQGLRNLVDIHPTLLELLSLSASPPSAESPPPSSLSSFPFTSRFSPHFFPGRSLFTSVGHNQLFFAAHFASSIGIREDKWKVLSENDYDVFFDVEADPAEQHPTALNAGSSATVRRLGEQLQEWRERKLSGESRWPAEMNFRGAERIFVSIQLPAFSWSKRLNRDDLLGLLLGWDQLHGLASNNTRIVSITDATPSETKFTSLLDRIIGEHVKAHVPCRTFIIALWGPNRMRNAKQLLVADYWKLGLWPRSVSIVLEPRSLADFAWLATYLVPLLAFVSLWSSLKTPHRHV